MPPPKLALAHVPTPLWRHDALDALVGAEVWVKRDDMTGGRGRRQQDPQARVPARRRRWRDGATVVVTCGGLQSNHARATAILARQLGHARSAAAAQRAHPAAAPRSTLATRFSTRWSAPRSATSRPSNTSERTPLMQEVARELERAGERAYVIPEGGSCGLGALGYVDAMARGARAARRPAGGRAASASTPSCTRAARAARRQAWRSARLASGSHRARWPMAVCDDRAYFDRVTAQIVAEARALLDRPAPSERVAGGRCIQGTRVRRAERRASALHRASRTRVRARARSRVHRQGVVRSRAHARQARTRAVHPHRRPAGLLAQTRDFDRCL